MRYDLFYKISALLAIFILFLLFRYFILSKNNKKLKILQDKLNKLNDSLKLKVAVNGTINIQSAAFKSHAIEITVEGDDFVAYGFMSEFQQVLLNIISNAKDALIDNNIYHRLRR